LTANAALSSTALPVTSVVRTRLANGLTVLVRRDPSAPVVAIVTLVRAGYFDETDDVVGISHVLEHMYFKGTPSRGVGEIAKETKAAGGYLNAGTIYDHTSYYTVLPSSSFEAGLDVQADAYAHSLIDGDELARELEVIIQEAKRKADNPTAVATETLYELLHDRHRIRRWRIGREPGLRALRQDDVVGFYRNFYRPGNTILTIVGDVDPDEVLADVTRRYGALAAGDPTRIPGPSEGGAGGFRHRDLTGDIAQTQIAFGWRTPGTNHADTPALELLAGVLGSGRASRLYRAVRERRLASAVSAYHYTPTEIGVFVAHAETPPAAAAEAARAIWAQIRAVRDGEVGDHELERAKRVFESRWIRRLEDMEGQANHLAEWEALGDWRIGDDYFERVMLATRDDVTRVANEYLAPDRTGVVVYRPSTSDSFAKSGEEMRALLDREPDPAPLAPPPAYSARILPGATTPEFVGEVSGVFEYRTQDGTPILVRTKPGSLLVHAGVFMIGGVRDEESALSGLTTLMVRTALKGTSSRSAEQIAEEGELLGGSVSGAAGSDSFRWSISVPSRHATAAVELLADVVQHPTFGAESLETERAIALADLAALRDDMYRFPMRLATEAAFAGHPYGLSAGGTDDSLHRITVNEVHEWHAKHALESACVIALVGDANPAYLAELAARAFSGMRRTPVTPIPSAVWPSSSATAIETRDRAQTAMALLFSGPSRSDPARYAASMIALVASGLGGRFFEELRDKRSLCYTVNAFVAERALAGAFGAYIATSPEQEDAARDGLLAEFARLRDEPVSEQELRRAQTYAIGLHAIRQQSGAAVLADAVDAYLFGSLGELEEYEARIRAVTPGEMRSVAMEHFDPSRRVEGIVRGTGKRV
jgi:zinc protease